MLLGRFVFHTPTSLQTTPPLTPCLLISRLLSIFPTHSLRLISWLGLSESLCHIVYIYVCVCVCPRVFACVLVSVKSSSSAFCVNSVSYLKASSHHGSLSYRNIQPFNSASPFSRYNNKAHSFTRCPSFFSFLLPLSPFVIPLPLCLCRPVRKPGQMHAV